MYMYIDMHMYVDVDAALRVEEAGLLVDVDVSK